MYNRIYIHLYSNTVHVNLMSICIELSEIDHLL